MEVHILLDRIEIVSHPEADRSISEEGLRTYRIFNRRYRNRCIGDLLKEIRLTEGRNTGFWKILNVLERNSSPKPIFETDPERLYLKEAESVGANFQTWHIQSGAQK
ncbi:ATP-binding protein [uncultured Dysosmobacter sp.]|uniref:ATP-binding protein n=1 Tax=uncultured Dysosmobacter sp. TaxID=2591384 RepID=UPI002632A880|nr:ATP-binding protein [uncultured Dysosmobacter sp.]